MLKQIHLTELKANLLCASHCILGESPLWDATNNCWLWIDIEGKKLFRYYVYNKLTEVHPFTHRVSLIVHDGEGNLVLGTDKGIYKYDLQKRLSMPVTDLGVDWTNMRCNDGSCDSEGRLWIGTMALDHKERAGSVYCVEDNRVSVCIRQVSIPNGIAWSPDNTRMYHTDSPTGTIAAYRFDSRSGKIEFERIAVRIPGTLGLPDGIAMDQRGVLWVAIWGGKMVGGFDVDTGELVSRIRLEVPYVTSCAFGGKNMDQLIITTARSYQDANLTVPDENSGGTYIVSMSESGLPAYKCAL